MIRDRHHNGEDYALNATREIKYAAQSAYIADNLSTTT